MGKLDSAACAALMPVLIVRWLWEFVYEGFRGAWVVSVTPSGRAFAASARRLRIGDTPDGVRAKMRSWGSVHPYFMNCWAMYDRMNDESDRHAPGLYGPTGWNNRVCDGSGKMVYTRDGEQRDPSVVIEFAGHRVIRVLRHNNYFVF